MTPRHATPADIPRLLGLARREHAHSLYRDVPFSDEQAARTMLEFIEAPGRTLLTTPGGYLGGQVQNLGFSPQLVALEYAWYAEDGTGIALLSAFERWARRMGARWVVVQEHGKAGRLAMTLGQRKGYGCIGEALMRPLED